MKVVLIALTAHVGCFVFFFPSHINTVFVPKHALAYIQLPLMAILLLLATEKQIVLFYLTVMISISLYLSEGGWSSYFCYAAPVFSILLLLRWILHNLPAESSKK